MTSKNELEELEYDESKDGPLSQAARDALRMLNHPETIKIRSTLYLDGDLLERIKIEAKKDNQKYQPWLNAFLRKTLMNEADYEDRLVERLIGRITERLKNDFAIEKKKSA